jgi:dTDP-glucose 4,6-dehydratase
MATPAPRAKYLVTGAGGFIGSHLTEALVRSGREVRAFVHYNSFNSWGWLDFVEPEIQKSIDVFAGDIRDPYGVRKAVEGCSTVIHLAALIGIPFSYYSPESYVETNVTGTLNVLQAALQLGADRVIHTSTSEVYGTALSVPINEDHPLQAQSPYSASKIGADQIAISYYNSFGLPVSIARPFNTYGPRQSARAVIPTIIMQIANGKSELELGSLHPTRDFNYVEDTVNAYLAIAEAEACIGEVLNVGSGYEISIGDTAQMIARLMDREVALVTDQQRLRPVKSEVNRLLADNTKVREATGWSPSYALASGLEKGLDETIRWFTEEDNLRRFRNIYKDRYNV